MAKQYKRPKNDFVSSDSAYWYLREVDHLLEVPVCGPSRLEALELVGTGGVPLRVADIVTLQSERERLVALESGGRCLHLYSGPDLQPSTRIELPEPVRRIAASSKGLYLLNANGAAVRHIRLSVLAGMITMSEGRDNVIDFDRIPLESHRLPPELGGREDLLFVATPTYGPKPSERLLLCSPDLMQVHTVLVAEQGLVGSRIQLAGPKPVLRAPFITAAGGSSDGSIFLFNEPTGQVLAFAPASARPTLRVIAGDGVLAKGHNVNFARSTEARLRPLASISEFRIYGRILDELGELARFSPSEEYASSSNAVASRSLKSIGPQIRALIEQGSFLVCYDRISGSISTISAPDSIERVRALADTQGPRVMPLRLPSVHLRRIGQTPENDLPSADTSLSNWDGCVLGPDSSLIFWRRDTSELLRYAINFSVFDELRRDAAFMHELNTRKGQVGRLVDFSDS